MYKYHFDKIRILLVEKERSLSIIFAEILQREGWKVVPSNTFANMRSNLLHHNFDILLISESISKANHFSELLEETMKLNRERTKCIAMLNSDRSNEKLDLISLGIDDIIVKPFHPMELAYRVKNVLRMINIWDASSVSDGEIKLDFSRGELRVRGSKVLLTPKEAYILRMLFQNRGDYIRIDKLSDLITKRFQKKMNENNTRVSLSRLKGKISSQSGYELIRCRRSRGYYLSF